MAMIVNQNPPQPPVPDEIEQRLQNQVRTAYLSFKVFLFAHAGSRFTFPIILVYFIGWMNDQKPTTFLDNYYIYIGYYCLFLILLPITAVICFHDRLSIMNNDWILYYFAAAECGFISMTLAPIHFHGIVFSRDYLYYSCAQVHYSYQSVNLLSQVYPGYLASKDLKLYQHGTRHRLSYLPNGVKGS